MKIELSQVQINAKEIGSVSEPESFLIERIAKKLRIPSGKIDELEIRRVSVDARKKPEIFFVYTIFLTVDDRCGNSLLKGRMPGNWKIAPASEVVYQLPEIHKESIPKDCKKPVIVGCGPAGLFCAWELCKAGLAPIVLERGRSIEERVKDVEAFWKDASKLNTESNVSFGEGGAGTFSDGKLNTMVKDYEGRYREMLTTFVRFGAPKDILYRAKPHIGTDCLRNVIRNMRQFMIDEYGALFRFQCCVTDLVIKNGALAGFEVNHCEVISADYGIFCIGHSARDTFAMLQQKGIMMEKKAFAVGLRIAHPQQMIDFSQYGMDPRPNYLNASDYKLTANVGEGQKRGVYSFCMCPGGYVVNASSEKGMIAVNGMSDHARDSKNANSALIVTVGPDDYKTPADSVLDGVTFQRELETRAYRAGNGKIPVQLLGDFRENRVSTDYGAVEFCVKGETEFGNLRDVLPDELSLCMIEGIGQFERRIRGFGRYDAVLAGIESRTSSPVRILRDQESLESVSCKGLIPCGEGAGYAGGISSAAIDGMKAAEAVIRRLCLL